MARHTAQPQFDYVAFERNSLGELRWSHVPRTIANAKAKAKREGYTNFFIAYSDHPRGWITNTMRIVRCLFDDDSGKWIYS